jgi:DNA-binding LacI/PurR family transcriptional regulator
MANIYDVARLANVSTATVSKVLSNTPYVSVQTKERVLEAVRQLDYSPSLAARGLTNRRTYILGLVIPNDPDYLFTDPQLLEVIRGVENTANDNDYNILLSMAKKTDQRSAYTRVLRTGYIDGAITVETFEGETAGKLLDDQGLPRVSIGYRNGLNPLNSVHSDDYRGAYEAVKHLIELDHQQIGVISGPANFVGAMEERLRGAQTALAEANLELNPDFLTYGDFTAESGYQASRVLLEAADRPTAIFSMNDRMATGVMRRARELGLRVPDDLSLVGFDDISLAALLDPPLTTIRQPSVEQGRVAVNKLFELIKEGKKEFETVILPVELIVRGSTARLNSA